MQRNKDPTPADDGPSGRPGTGRSGPATQPDAKSVELYPDPVTRLARLGKYDEAIKLGKKTLAKVPAGAAGNVDKANAIAAARQAFMPLPPDTARPGIFSPA